MAYDTMKLDEINEKVDALINGSIDRTRFNKEILDIINSIQADCY
jgi:hypothetical protein